MARKPARQKRPMTDAQRAALEKAQAARRKQAPSFTADEPGRATAPAQGPAFLDPPPPEARPVDDKSAAPLIAVEDEITATYAGAHFMAAFATGIEQLQVKEAEAREVAKRFVRMMKAWGIPLDELASGRLLATMNFALLFGMIELSKLTTLRTVLLQRQAAAAQAAQATQAEPEPVAGDHGPAPGVQQTGPGAMGQPFSVAAE